MLWALISQCSYKIFKVYTVYRKLRDSSDKSPFREKNPLFCEIYRNERNLKRCNIHRIYLPRDSLSSSPWKEWHLCQSEDKNAFPSVLWWVYHQLKLLQQLSSVSENLPTGSTDNRTCLAFMSCSVTLQKESKTSPICTSIILYLSCGVSPKSVIVWTSTRNWNRSHIVLILPTLACFIEVYHRLCRL